MMKLYDTHFHYSGETTPAEYMNLVGSDLARACSKAGVPETPELYLTAVGGDYLESARAREFAAVTPHCFFAAGVHPHGAAEHLASRRDFSVFHDDQRLVAVGELGLDYYYDLSDRAAQRQVFADFLELALLWDLPAIVHLRDRDGVEDAYCDGLDLLEPFAGRGGRFVVHCYAGSREHMEAFAALGAYIGVTGMATFRAAAQMERQVLSICLDFMDEWFILMCSTF